MAQKTPFYELHIEAGAKMIEFAGWEMPLHYGNMLEEHRRVRGACGLFDLSHMGEIEISGPRALEVVQLMTTNDASRLEPGQAQYSLICREDGGILDDIVVYRLPDADLGCRNHCDNDHCGNNQGSGNRDESGRSDSDHSDSDHAGSNSNRVGVGDGGGSARGNSSYLLVLNAANTAKDHKWIYDNSKAITGSSPGRGPGAGLVGGVGGTSGMGGTSGTSSGTSGTSDGAGSSSGSGARIRDCSSDTALLAIQGPGSQEVLQRLTGIELGKLRYYRCARGEVAGVDSLVSRTGYTGEDGFEIYFDPGRGQGAGLWGAILDAGREFEIIPCGLGARDTLRIEAGYPLYGHELTEETSPFAAGLGWAVKLGKGDFIGRGALAEAYRKPISRRLRGFKLRERGVPRPGCEIRRDGVVAGIVTSGTLSPTLGVGIGLGYLAMPLTYGDEISVVIRGREVKAEVTKIPFVPSRARR